MILLAGDRPYGNQSRAMSEIAKGCSHFQEFKKTSGLYSYGVIYKYLINPMSISPEARKLKVSKVC